jgi:prevent-host-death family protein
MIKKISAIKARHNLGQIMNEVSLRGEDYIIERAGKPLVAVIPIEKYKQIQEEKKEFFDWVDEVRAKNEFFSIQKYGAKKAKEMKLAEKDVELLIFEGR